MTTGNRMQGWVGIAFEDCDLNQKDLNRIRGNLPACHILVVKNGKMTTLKETARKSHEQVAAHELHRRSF
jgi:hypothetical protein